MGLEGIVGYLILHEAYSLWAGYHFQIMIYTHEPRVRYEDEEPAQLGFEPCSTKHVQEKSSVLDIFCILNQLSEKFC